MTEAPKTIEALFDAFGTIVNFSESVGCGYEAARQMRRRNSIPVKFWPAVVRASIAVDIEGVSYDALVQMHLPAAEAA